MKYEALIKSFVERTMIIKNLIIDFFIQSKLLATRLLLDRSTVARVCDSATFIFLSSRSPMLALAPLSDGTACNRSIFFLDASSHLYVRSCPFVGWSDGWSVTSPTLTLLNVLNVLDVLNVLHVLNMPMDASLACWALFKEYSDRDRDRKMS